MIKVFNWIFVAIAGAIILLFFFKILAVHTSISEKESTAKLISSFDSLINKISSSSQTQNFITVPEKKYLFSCEEPCSSDLGCESYLSIERSDTEVKFPTQVIISPNRFQTSRLYSFTLSWDVPFHVTDFLILSPSEQRIVVDCGTSASLSKCNSILSKIPSYFKSAGIITTGSTLGNADKIVSFSCSSNYPGICVQSDRLFLNGVEKRFFTDEEIIAAIFSPSSDFYDCSMNKAYYKMNSVASILDEKKEVLSLASDQLNCETKFNSIDLSPYFIEYESLDFSNQDNLIQMLTSLSNDNNYLRVGSCGALY